MIDYRKSQEGFVLSNDPLVMNRIKRIEDLETGLTERDWELKRIQEYYLEYVLKELGLSRGEFERETKILDEERVFIKTLPETEIYINTRCI